jgi:hypothetical protein
LVRHLPTVTRGPCAKILGMTAALAAAVRDIERHVARAGWDGPTRLYALVPTDALLTAQPELGDALAPPDSAGALAPDHLTPVEQEQLPPHDTVLGLLAQVAWPDEVTGAALVIERVTLPPEAEAQLPVDPARAQAYAATHPQRHEVRLVVAVLREGSRSCALRSRAHDVDDAVLVAPDLVPDLAAALAATFAP